MEYGAIDLHKKESQIRIVTRNGEIIDQRIATTRDRLTHVFWAGGCGFSSKSRQKANGSRSTSSRWDTRSSSRIRITRRCTGTGAAGSKPIGAMWRR